MKECWEIIESRFGAATAWQWKRWLGPGFDAVAALCLRKTGQLAPTVSCPHNCECGSHRLVKDGAGFVGSCSCGECDDLLFRRDEIEVFELKLDVLGQAVCKALGCSTRKLPVSKRTVQIGAFGADAMPIFLTIPEDEAGLQNTVAALAAKRNGPFVLLAPNSQFVKSDSQNILDGVKSGFFALENILEIMGSGSLHAPKKAGELFSRYLPETQVAPDKSVACRADAKLGNGAGVKPIPRYLLRRGVGLWRVVYDGEEGEIDQGRGISLVAYLLFNPPLGGLHGTELAKLAFGQEILQEASLGSDGDSTRRLIEKEAKEWMAVMKNPGSSEIEKAEALEHLEKLAEAINVTRADSEGGADKQVRAVRRAIERLIDKLRGAKDRKNDPHIALRAFGEHLHERLWIPSSRFSGNRRSRIRAGVAGQFTYEPPDGIVWVE